MSDKWNGYTIIASHARLISTRVLHRVCTRPSATSSHKTRAYIREREREKEREQSGEEKHKGRKGRTREEKKLSPNIIERTKGWVCNSLVYYIRLDRQLRAFIDIVWLDTMRRKILRSLRNRSHVLVSMTDAATHWWRDHWHIDEVGICFYIGHEMK